jgi:spermidine/putrescine transport system substrate-binding protein
MYLYAISDVEPTRAGRHADRLNRRELLGAGAIALAAAACGGSTGGGSAPSVASSSLTKKKIESTLNFYNWAQYHDPSNAKAFSQKYGVAFKESNYASNEELLTKLQTTKGQPVYDIIVPDADHVRIEKNLGLLMKLDHSLLPNLKNLAPHWRQLSYDPGNQYSVMKDTGLTGFTMRTDHVSANLQTWKDFFDFLPHAGGLNVNFIESPAEVIGVALNALGFSMNSESDAELNAARDLLLKVRPHVNTINEVYLDDFIAGKIDLGITYSGDGLRIRSARKKQGDIRVVAPLGRSEIWIDNWAISAYAPDPVAAHAWINYMLDPAVNAREMQYVQYEVGTPASYPLVGAEAKDPLVVFPQRILDNYEILYTTPTGLNKRTAIWGEFKAG